MLRKNTHQLIIEKIEQLQSSLFFSESSDRVIPSCVLQHVYTDEQDQVWFAIPKPAYVIDPNNNSFPCRMEFFKKGASFHVKISGIATIIDEEAVIGCPSPLADSLRFGKDGSMLIIKVRIEQADCFEIAGIPAEKKDNGVPGFISNAFSKIAGRFLGKTLTHETVAYS